MAIFGYLFLLAYIALLAQANHALTEYMKNRKY